jgi:hypothetical protein
MNRFIDDVSVLAIEDCLIGKVANLFRSSQFLEMSPDDVSRLAGETEESSVERKHLTQKRKILDAGLRGLKDLQRRTETANPAPGDHMSLVDSENESDKITPCSRKASTANSIRSASTASSIRSASPTLSLQEVPESQETLEKDWNAIFSSDQATKKSKKSKRLRRELFAVFEEP